MVEITATEQNIEKRIKRNEDTLRDSLDNIKCNNICITVVLGEEERETGGEKIFEEVIAKNFLNIAKEIVNQVLEAHRVPKRINPRRNTRRHIVIKMMKIKDKDKTLKETKER